MIGVLHFSQDEFLQRPLKVQLLLVVALALLLQVPMAFYISLPRFGTLKELESEVHETQKEAELLKEQVTVNQDSEIRLSEMRALLREKRTKWVAEADADSLLASLSQLAIDNSLDVRSFTRNRNRNEAVLSAKFLLKGSYYDISRFTHAIAKLPYMIVVKNLSLHRAERSAAPLNAEIHFKVYIKEGNADE